ncbi:Asp-tRNA(Asn)/Glu-tRNA(Gln) amidotransferase subunit GatA [Ferruginibacter sp. HRS2-29]|uniref:Asp-tRNA(Asn)/Glu-tRNA(Gln) amidotransferase subunit GatA n=1 Tax=Ferruginibacter sp. HRS2-29 TaxID=2487334 RepID=UPI0020CF0F51|nr:Asp-tRNA(Asn)/Glu-tRNA(Gln) amidotransferase subunit GatA [Ferruginibacter sp. HRS2-29]MCP9752127.1 Asp-tRNA(Asn)/Glu-tRNA(Gln) amidotransferase subunit GatA [Ferruginibacter sp. HRS2-29]
MFVFNSITDYHHQLKSGTTSCLQAVNHFLSRIKEKAHLNAFVEVYEKEALAKAAELDAKRNAGEPLKKLHGVVIAIKDVICYKDHSVTAASAILKGFNSLYTASALQYLLNEDAIIIGNCNCDEFAMGSTNENSSYGKVLNALDETKVPGGSSGGSAVAVQAGMCMLSLGSDTGGSVRQPADFCGIIGLKPGYGRISRYGLLAYASSFDQIGIFGTHVPDVALLLQIMSQPDKMDSTMDKTGPLPAFENPEPTPLRYCLFSQVMDHPSLDPEIRDNINALAEKLETEGNTVTRLDFEWLDYIVPAYYVLTTAEASSNLSRYDGVRYGHRSEKATEDLDAFYRNNRSEGFGMEVKRRIMLGTFVLSTGYYDAYYSKAQKIRRLLTEKITEIFEGYDAILMPTVPSTAMSIGQHDKDPVEMYLADIFTVFANLTGIPGISLPLFSHSNNMPFGLQVMTNKQEELPLLHIADRLMQQYKPVRAL